jgi:iron complex outermembrane receptor protein
MNRFHHHTQTPCRYVRTGFVLALALGFPLGALAQERLEPVVIESTRVGQSLDEVPAAVSVVDRDEIQQGRQQLGLDESLTGVPGVFAQNRYNAAQDLRISIRGFGARSSFGIRGIRILVDGIPLTGPDGQSNVDDVDIGSLERIEVLRGPAGSLYGASAGGVLSLYTEDGGGEPFAEARASAGSYGFQQYQLKAGGEAGATAYRVNASVEDLDGYRDQSATSRRLLNGKLQHRWDTDSDLTATWSVLHSPKAQDPGGLTAEQAKEDPRQAAPINQLFDTGERVQQQRLGLSYRLARSDGGELRLRGYGVHRDFENKLPFSAVELDRIVLGGGLEYTRQTRIAGRTGRLLLGFDLDGQDDDRVRRENDQGAIGDKIQDQRERVDGQGAFGQLEQDLGARLRLDLGLRYDRVGIDVDDRFLADGDDSGDTDFGAWSPSIALSWAALEQTRLYARIASAFETPTTTELAAPDGGGGLNEDLDPQRSINYELGARGMAGASLGYELAVFYIDVDDEIVPFEIPGSPGRFAFENAGRSTYRGLESAVSLPIFDDLTARLAYTYSDFRFDRFTDRNGLDLDGNRVPGVPRHLLNLALSYRDTAGRYATWETRYVGETDVNNENSAQADAYWLTDLRAGYDRQFGGWLVGVFAGVNNLFDASYNANLRLNATGGRYFEPAPERNLYAGLSLFRPL